MTDTSGVRSIDTARRASADAKLSKAQLILNKIGDKTSNDLMDMLQSMFDGIDDSLFELANNAHTNNEQNRFFEAMREIRIKRKSVEARFADGLSKLFSLKTIFNENDPKSAEITDVEGLSLVKNEELEEDVAVSTMATKAQANFQGPLLLLHKRFSALLNADEEAMHQPMDPSQIANTFAEACEELDIGIGEKLIVLKQFDRYVLGNMGSTLDAANSMLIQLGVLPELRNTNLKSRPTPRSGSQSAPLGANAQSPQGQSSGENDIFQEIQSLLRNARALNRSQTVSNNDGSVHFINPNDLLKLLSDLQKAPANQEFVTDRSAIIDVKAALMSLLRNESAHSNKTSLNEKDEDLINLVAMLFEFILDDYNLPAQIQVLISRLQIPILKVVIKDRGFFNDHNNPARRLLNMLAKAGIGWGNNTETHNDKLFSKIQQVVERILSEFDGDLSLFEELYMDFSSFIKKEERKANIVEQRTKEAEEGRIKSKQAQEKVETILKEKINQSPYAISELVMDTLKNGWSRVMFLSYLRDDSEHQWQHSVQVAEDLIWCLQPLTLQDDRQHWIKVVPKLLKDLKRGLQEVSYKASELDETIEAIKGELTSSFRSTPMDAAKIAQAKRDSSKQKDEQDNTESAQLDSAIAKQVHEKQKALAPLLEQVEQLEVGTWVEFKNKEASTFRCKLSTFIPEADCYIFVNRMGLKVLQKSKLELANDMLNGHIKSLEQGMLIDRAMSSVMSKLKGMATA